MSQTILIESNTDLQKIFSLNLSTYTGTDVVIRNDAAEAIELLRILPSISLIVSESKLGNEDTAVEIYNFLEENQLEIPMIVLGECPEIAQNVLTLARPISWEILIKHAGTLLGVSEEELKEKVKPAYIPILSSYFYEIDHTPCDIYIRIKKSAGEFKFVKRIHSQDKFGKDDIDKYVDQGLKYFYIGRDYQQYFVTFVTNNLIGKLEKDMPIEERLNTNANAYEIVKDHIRNMGMSSEISELAEANIQSMVTAVQENTKLSNLLKLLFSSKVSYAYQKSHLICVIGNFILKKQSWYELQHLQVLTHMAFFSDITLKSQLQMKVNSAEDLASVELSEEEREQVINHAKDAAAIVKDYPPGTDYLQQNILHHHGSLTGEGFPEQPSNDIDPIAKIFIIADAFVKTLLNPHAPKNKKEILVILYMQFSDEGYQKIIKVLEQKMD